MTERPERHYSDRAAIHSLLPPDQRGFATGVLLILLGVAMLILVWSYPVGMATRMGAGYWPRVVAGLMIGVGALNAIAAYFSKESHAVTLPPFKQFVIVPVAILLFAFTVEWLGFIVAAALVVGVSALASSETRWRETAVLAAGLIVFCSILFVFLLGLSLRLLPEGIL